MDRAAGRPPGSTATGQGERRDRGAHAQPDRTALLAHDIAAPLTIILAHAQRLEQLERRRTDDGAALAVLSSIRAIKESSWMLSRLAAELLRAAEASTQVPEGGRKAVDLTTLAQDVVGRVAVALDGHPIELDCQVRPVLVLAEATGIERVLLNLLTNAAKYSPTGTPIRLEISGATTCARVSVLNHGGAISGAEAARVFNPRHRTRAARASAIPGHGLGLHICQQIVEAHGGGIWVESDPNRAAAVRFTLPLADPGA